MRDMNEQRFQETSWMGLLFAANQHIEEKGHAGCGRPAGSPPASRRRGPLKISLMPLFLLFIAPPLLLLSACDPPSDAELAGYPNEKLEKVATRGSTAAQVLLADRHRDGDGVSQDYEKAAELYRLAADQGDAHAQRNLGDMYFRGNGVEQDDDEAVRWFRKAAEQNYARAQIDLANVYKMGRGVEKDVEQAATWLRKAADQGSASGQLNLGVWYSRGIGVRKDQDEAIFWYEKAAEQGNVIAMHNLGSHYDFYWKRPIKGRRGSYKLAMIWFRRAADLGYAPSQANLADMYYIGTGEIKRDYAQAMMWFRKAADQGNVDSQHALGYMFHKGLGVEPDPSKALHWYTLAADQGNELSIEQRTELALENRDNGPEFRQYVPRRRGTPFNPFDDTDIIEHMTKELGTY